MSQVRVPQEEPNFSFGLAFVCLLLRILN